MPKRKALYVSVILKRKQFELLYFLKMKWFILLALLNWYKSNGTGINNTDITTRGLCFVLLTKTISCASQRSEMCSAASDSVLTVKSNTQDRQAAANVSEKLFWIGIKVWDIRMKELQISPPLSFLLAILL